jgi:hypothetical protein
VETIFGRFLDPLNPKVSNGFFAGTGVFVLGDRPGFGRNNGSIGPNLIDRPYSTDAFTAWDMLTSIGPISGPGDILQWSLSPVLTSGGTLILDNASVDVAFSAIVSVPELSTWAMMLLGFAGLGFAGYRQRQKGAASV